ncbi:lysis system i-spanin subunit Rz [Achromobacter insuavis]|uniref:lysis system i-spanin subunit Rz n=1 Tax=Achromobacter insuavis TaxID=1287735 RepID=UPI001C553AF0|nr:lysis system i-spanin subunit Rz [Achromobacter insuavis]
MSFGSALIGWRGYAAAALAGGLAFGAAAWTAQGWRYGEQLAVQRAARAEEVADGQRQAREILAQRHAAVADINERNARAEWAAYGGLRNAQIQDEGLRVDVDAGRQRLHVRAACPAAGDGVSETGVATRVDHGAGAELDPAARSDYFALRAGIQQLTAQLSACQARLR